MQPFFFVRCDGKYLRINYNDIICIEGCKNYVRITTEKKAHLVLATMKRMELLLPQELFIRVHKSYIIPLERVTAFNSEVVYLTDRFFPVGKQYRGCLEKAVQLIVFDQTNEPSMEQRYTPFCTDFAAA